MAEPDIGELNIALTMAAGCLERDGRPNTAFVVRRAIAALEDRDRLRAAAQKVDAVWERHRDRLAEFGEYHIDAAVIHLVGTLHGLRAALEGRDG